VSQILGPCLEGKRSVIIISLVTCLYVLGDTDYAFTTFCQADQFVMVHSAFYEVVSEFWLTCVFKFYS